MLTDEEIEGVGIALNEATLVGIEINEPAAAAGITLEVLALPADDRPSSEDRRIQIVLRPIGRVVASLRNGNWNDEAAEVLPLTVADLLTVTAEMKSEIHGWKFIDLPENMFEQWSNRPSFDLDLGARGRTHSITLFQSAAKDGLLRHLDIRIWFDEISFWTPSFDEIPIEEFIAGGRRWWKAFNADPRMREVAPGHYIIPLAELDGE